MLAAWRRGQDRSTILQRYGSALEVTSGSLDAGRLEALESLPHPRLTEVGGKRVRLCHGSPWDIDCYVYPDAADDIRRRVTAAAQDVDLMLLGHTHHPMVWTEGRTMIVNPGSVGQPRDRKPGAAWALWDTAAHEVTLRRTAYDPTPTIEECRWRDPDLNYLVNVLVRTS
jgi:predicted phosphodiesterase